jgi:hypothetical protein
LSIPAFCLGWFFPLGLRLTNNYRPALVPWAWSINACASVVGAVLAKLLAVSIGFRMVLLIAGVLYLMATLCFKTLFQLNTTERIQ